MHQKACVSQQHELLTTTSRPKKKICRELQGTQDVQVGTQRADIQNFPYSS